MTRGADTGGASTHVSSSDLYLFEILPHLWRRRWLIVSTMLVFAALSAAVAFLLPSWYRAEVLLVPSEERSTVPIVSQLAGLAGLAGISVGGGDDVAEAVAVLQSREFTRGFIESLNLLPVLYADDWDAEAGAWNISDPEDIPDLRDAVRYFDENVRTVSHDRRTDFVTLSIEWTDPAVAAQWANTLAEMVNDQMRARVLKEASDNVKFLRGELDQTMPVALQQAIASLLESEMQKLMLARGSRDFAFRVIDHAEVPKRHSRPQRGIIIALSTAFGGAVSSLLVLLFGANRGQI